MQALKKENEQLKKSVESILQQIQNQKEINAHHQNQIETLLKFNQRLLSIIQNELNAKKDSFSLQPISQRSQRQSELLGQALNPLMKSRQLVAKSQRGVETHYSLVERVRATNSKLVDIFKQKERLNSEQNKSYEEQGFSDRKIQYKTTVGAISPANNASQRSYLLQAQDMSKKLQSSKLVKEQMSNQIAQLKKFRKQSATFYDSKIREIKDLSSKINRLKPVEQLKNIAKKLTLSKETSELLQKTVLRGEKKK